MQIKTRLHLLSAIQDLLGLLLGTDVAIVNDECSASCQNKMESLVSNLNKNLFRQEVIKEAISCMFVQ